MSNELYGKDPDQMTLIIGGKEIIVESMTLIKTIDTAADAFSAVIPWEPGKDPELDRVTLPFTYENAEIYIGNDLESAQILYDVKNKLTNEGSTKELGGFSKTADIIDSTVIPPYQMSNVKLTDRCRQQCTPFGIHVIVGEDAERELLQTRRVTVVTRRARGFPVGVTLIGNISNYQPINISTAASVTSRLVVDERKFPRVKAEPTDGVFDHLAKLAAQRGLLLSCTKIGDLLITKANVNAEPVGTIEESISPLSGEYIAEFKGRDRFAVYRAITSSNSSRRPRGQSIARDAIVLSPRLLSFNADDDIPGNAQNAAEWRKNKTAADAMTLEFPVNSWYAPNGTVWQPNTTVVIISPTMGIPDGFTFMIARVEYNFTTAGASAKLSLKPPTVYTTGEVEEPWLEGPEGEVE